MRDKEGQSLGFGFVCFVNYESAMQARHELHKEEGGLYVRQALKK